MNSKNGNHRVLAVILLFVPLSLIAMWFIGGTQQTIELTVQSSLPPNEMQQRFEQVLARLQPLTAEQLAERASMQDFGSKRFGNQGSNITTPSGRERLQTRPVNYVSPTTPTGNLLQAGFSLPLADIVLPENLMQDESVDIDPSIIYRDPEFVEKPVARNWLGKDNRNVYLEEMDTEEHMQLIRLERSKLRFEPTIIDGKSGTRIVYPISIHHRGMKRIYGKFLERECEDIAKRRLEWICEQLEAASAQ